MGCGFDGCFGVNGRRQRLAARLLPAAMCVAGLLSSAACDLVPRERFSDYIGPANNSGAVKVEGAVPSAAASTMPSTTQPSSQPGEAGPVVVSVSQAILMSLENNRGLIVDRFTPDIRRTAVDVARAVFDPLVSGEVSQSHTQVGRLRNVNAPQNPNIEATAATLLISEFLPTGTQVNLRGSTLDSNPDLNGDQSRIEMTVTQSLLRGAGTAVNLATLRQASIDVLISQYELRGFVEALVADVERTYCDYVLAQRQIEIFQQSVAIAQQQLDETKERIKVGKLAETELAAAESEVALRNEDLINARSQLATVRLHMLQLLSPPSKDLPNGQTTLWSRPLVLTDQARVEGIKLDDVEKYVLLGLRFRPDLNQARLHVQRGDLELVKTRNGLLPRLDFFVRLGGTGFAQSFGGAQGGGFDATVGLTGDWSPINRAANALNRGAKLNRDQSLAGVANLAQTIQTDVRGAYVQVILYQEQITATAATRKSQEETLRAETEKFRIGKSTSFLVGRAQRDLLSTQISEVQAQVNYLKAIVDLHRLDGSLLQRLGIAAPGDQPVVLEEDKGH